MYVQQRYMTHHGIQVCGASSAGGAELSAETLIYAPLVMQGGGGHPGASSASGADCLLGYKAPEVKAVRSRHVVL
jgi:hypothetical protein